MYGLPVGSHCPHILHSDPPPRLHVNSVRIASGPDGRPRLIVGGAADLEWDVVSHLSCPKCGSFFRASQAGEKITNIVLSQMDPRFHLAPRLITETSTKSIRPTHIPRILKRDDPHMCRSCSNATLEALRPILLIDKHVSSQLVRLERHRNICKTLLNTYHYCTRCLSIFESAPSMRTITQQTFQQLLDDVRLQTGTNIQAETPEDLLRQLILP